MDSTADAQQPTIRSTGVYTPLGQWINRQIKALMLGGVAGNGMKLEGYMHDDPRARLHWPGSATGWASPSGHCPNCWSGPS